MSSVGRVLFTIPKKSDIVLKNCARERIINNVTKLCVETESRLPTLLLLRAETFIDIVTNYLSVFFTFCVWKPVC